MKHVEGSLLRVLKQVEEAVGPLRRWAMSEAEPVCMPACTRLQEEMQCEHKHAVVRTADSSCGRTWEHVHHTTGSPTAGSHTAPQADAARANHDKEKRSCVTSTMSYPGARRQEDVMLTAESPILDLMWLERSLADLRRQIESLQE